MIKEILKPRTLFALMFYGTFCYLILMDKHVPDALTNIITLLFGFYFGQRAKKGNGNENIPSN